MTSTMRTSEEGSNPLQPPPGPDRVLLLHELFERSAERFPDRVALDIPPALSRLKRIRLTYRALLQRSLEVAAAVAPLVRRDAVVAIMLPRYDADLYAAQLAVLQTGAAFTCIDPTFPDDHLAQVIRDVGAAALVTDKAGRWRCEAAGIAVPAIIDPNALGESLETGTGRSPSGADLAYVIYTSGTTGQPKGVMIEHASIATLIAADMSHFGLDENARVAQCSSPAYDSSIEETWLAFSVGAALVLLDDDAVRLGPDLTPWLARERITVLCPTPTLLRTTGCLDPARDLPDLALLYVGGEALAGELMNRWAVGRWMENGYGPTECTVTVVRGRVRPGGPVLIGSPVDGSMAFILDERLECVPDGEPGELCIGGASLARGYHGLEDLTRERFPDHPVLGRIYRTGDRVRRNGEGALEHLGRIDAQVKLRGYRIELGAVEAILTGCAGVRSAACTVQGEDSAQLLAAYVVPEDEKFPPDLDILKDAARRALPPYMIPARFCFLDTLPMTVGGKLDRKALPPIAAASRSEKRVAVPPRNATEQRIAQAFRRALRLTGEFSIHDDFFTDLGGDSLAAVEVVCDLREKIDGVESPGTVVRDVYEARTVARMAALQCIAPIETGAGRLAATRPTGRPATSTLIQGLWVMTELIASNAALYGLSLAATSLLGQGSALRGALLVACLGVLGTLVYIPTSVALLVLIKCVLIGRYRPMTTPVWGGFFTRHWIVISVARLVPWSFLAGTPLAPIVLRALGARVGRRVHVHRGVNLSRGGWDMLIIGDDVTLSQSASLRLADFVDGQLVIGPIRLENGATVGVRAGLEPDTCVGQGASLAPLSSLTSGSSIPPGEMWDGVPAMPAGKAPEPPVPTRGKTLPSSLYGVLALTSRLSGTFAFALAPLLFLITERILAQEESGSLAAWLDAPHFSPSTLPILCLIAGVALALGLAAMALGARLLGPVRPGVVGQYSLEALRILSKTQAVEDAGRWLSGSMFWPWWLRLAGMKVGRGCEISTIIDVIPETVSIGAESFFADGVYFCGPLRQGGVIAVSESRLGAGTFLGNHCLVPAGHVWPDGLFIGVSTVADAQRARPDTGWFGHPPMELPRREMVVADRSLTHAPGPFRFCARLFWEIARFLLPSLPILVGCAWWAGMSAATSRVGVTARALLIAPLLTGMSALTICLAVVALKWLLLGRMRPGQHAFWSCWCGRWDFLFMAWSLLAQPWLVLVDGTLILNAYLRLTGMTIGRRVMLEGFLQAVDPDMLRIDDDATVSCHIQAHSFEDRILKLDYIHIGRGASLGDNALLFYGVNVGECAVVKPHGVVMKRDRLRAGVRFEGCPVA